MTIQFVFKNESSIKSVIICILKNFFIFKVFSQLGSEFFIFHPLWNKTLKISSKLFVKEKKNDKVDRMLYTIEDA